MRVLVVTGRWDLVGGSERYAGEVVRGLMARGLQVRVLCEQGTREIGGQEEILCCPGLDDSRASKQTRSELRAGYADCDGTLVLSRISNGALGELLKGPPLVRFVQDHTLFCPGLNKLLANHQPCEKALGLACMNQYWLGEGCAGQQVQEFPSLRRPLQNLNRALTEIRVLQSAKRMLVASEYMGQELQRAGFRPEHVEVLPYFTRSNTADLPMGRLSEPTEEFWKNDSTFKLFCPARLVLPDKGIDFLLSAMGKLSQTVRLVIAGEGPARPWLEQKTREEGLGSQVFFSGWCPPEQIEAHYAACDAVVFPSVWNEPFGLVGLEAMAHSKPVVAFEVGGVLQWLVPGQTGLGVPRRDTDAMAKAIRSLCDDRILAQRLGQQGHHRLLENFDREQHMDRLVQVLFS